MFYDKGVGSGATEVPLNVWTHVAVVRLNSVVKLYIGGAQVGTVAHTENFTSTKINVGSPIGGVQRFKGCMASVRVVKSAVYSGTFTPPDVGSFSTLPDATTPLIALTADGNSFVNSGSGTSPTTTGTLTYQSLIQNQSSLTLSSTIGTFGSNLALTTAGGSGTGAVTFAVDSGPCSLSGATLTPTGAGTCMVTATKAANGNYLVANSSSTAITINQGTQVISYTTAAPSGATYSGSTYSPTATGGASGNAVILSIDATASSVCTISSGVISFTGVGTCKVNANQASSTNYSAAPQLQQTFTVSKASQLLSFTQPSDMTYGDVDQALTFSTNSGLTVAIASTTASVCTIVANKIHIVIAGTCTVTANQIGDTNYNAGTQASRTISISPAASTISVTGTTTNAYTGSPQGPSSNTKSGSGGSVTYSYQGTGATNYSANATKPTNVGSYTVIATLAADSYYASASSSAYAFTIEQIAESSALTIETTSTTYGTNLTLSTSGATGGSGVITYRVNSGSCTILASTLTPTAAGTCFVTATKETDGNYLAVLSASTAITVNPKGLTISGLTGVNKEFDGGLVATATGTPTLVGVVNSDNVLPGGTPVFTFASANVANGITVTASGYTLTGTTAGNYTLTQPTTAAYITAKAARVAATNTTVAFGAAVTSGFTTSALISPDAVGSTSYTYTGTGTSTPPTAVGVYTVTPSNAVFSTGSIGNYTITYDTATVTILAKYTITYNANGGLVSSASTATVDFVVGDTALTLPTPTRSSYTFTGWYTLQSNGQQVTGAYTPTATATLWAHWVQDSLYGMGTSTKILTITTLSGVGNTYSANAAGGTIAIEYLADALPAGTIIDAYVLSDTSTATTLIGSGNDYVWSLVLAWVAPDATVPTTASGKAISMTITNAAIKKGAKIYSVIGIIPTLLTIATTDGRAVISITDDPQIIIAITKPDAPTGVSATSGGNSSTTVSWTAPSDGGSAITSYTATSNAGQTCTSATTSCSVTSLTNGTPYTFTVTATNSIGISDASAASSAITPAALIVITPQVVTTPAASSSSGGGYVMSAAIDNSAAIAAAQTKMEADKKAAELNAAEEKKLAAEAEAAALKVAAELADAKAKADAELKAAADKAVAELRIAEELRLAQLKAEEELKLSAQKKATEDAALAAKAAKPAVTLYSVSSSLKLNAFNTAYLQKYVKSLKNGASVTCIGYSYSKNTTLKKANALAKSQATAVCALMKKTNKTLKTSVVIYPSTKAPKAATGAKWVGVSYRIDGFKAP
jgi:hypothetical protein